MLKIIAVIIAVAIAAILVLAATKPDHFHIERSATINAPVEKIQGLVSDFHQWSAWSPWEKLDPALKRTFSGPSSGPGAVYAWTGNSKVGQGRMEILKSSDSGVDIKLDFLKPMEQHNLARFAFAPSAAQTQVTWSMDGVNSFSGKVMQVFFSIDKLVGKDFEAGLANLKQRAEA